METSGTYTGQMLNSTEGSKIIHMLEPEFRVSKLTILQIVLLIAGSVLLMKLELCLQILMSPIDATLHAQFVLQTQERKALSMSLTLRKSGR